MFGEIKLHYWHNIVLLRFRKHQIAFANTAVLTELKIRLFFLISFRFVERLFEEMYWIMKCFSDLEIPKKKKKRL